MLPGHPLARQIDDFLTDLANANKPRNTIRAYRGDLSTSAEIQPSPTARRARQRGGCALREMETFVWAQR